MAELGPWLVLVPALILPKANRRREVLLILVPLAVVMLGWFLFLKTQDGSLSDVEVFNILVYSLAVGSATLWLLAHLFAADAWYKTLLAALAISLGVVLIGGVSLGLGSRSMLAALLCLGLMMIATVLGYALAARGYGARRAWRFFVLQAVGTVAASLAGIFLMGLAAMALVAGGPDGIGEFVAGVIVAGLIVGIPVFLIALPFAVMGLSSRFFRERLILCLPTKPADGPAGATAPGDVQP